eukprot:evm.model.scf_1061.2 EVM.evm.TU.scf_1061.2   scf_1061:6281-18352(+)
MAKLQTMRGLQMFISDIRGCPNKEAEQRRVEKELAKIREKFGSNKHLSSYDKKKYVWKLMYVYMLGYDVEFGHRQAADLIPAEKYAEKQVGYAACSILLNENHEFLRIAINSIRNDLISRNEAFQSLALSFIGNVGGQEMAESLTQDVMKILTSGTPRPVIRKKAALALLRLFRKMPLDAEIIQPSQYAGKIAALLEERDIGLLLAVVTLLLGVVSRASSAGYEACHSRVVKILQRSVFDKDVGQEYTYYGIPSPWLQVKALRVLQYFPPSEDPAIVSKLSDILGNIINGANTVKNPNKNNALHAILFEAIALCLHLDIDRSLLTASVAHVGKFLAVNDPNIKYLALENMSRLALVPEMLEAIRRHQKTITQALKDPDVSIRKRALDLLFTMCDSSNSVEIVQELIKYLTIADFSMREELTLKIAILAERFAPDVKWYVDVSLDLIEKAGEFVSDDIWHRVVQLVTNNEGMREYAANKVVEQLERGGTHEALVSVAAYVVGEYGGLVRSQRSPMELYQLLHARFAAASLSMKALLLSVYLKLMVMDPGDQELRSQVTAVFERYRKVMDAELQQRAVEYLALAQKPGEVQAMYIQPMPKWEARESSLLRRLAAQEGDPNDNDSAADTASVSERGLPVDVMAAPPTVDVAPANGTTDSLVDLDLMAPVPDSNGSAAPPPAAPGMTTDNVLDLLDGPIAGGPAAPATPVPVTAAPVDPFAASDVDPLGPLDGAAGGVGALPPGVQVLGDIEQWYRALTVKDKGILYEDTYLQIGVQTQYKSGSGVVNLFFGNKSESTMERLICAVPPCTEFNISVSPVPTSLAPKVQMQAHIQVQCLQAFSEPPRMQLAYRLDGASVTQSLKLPIILTKLMTPALDITKEEFFHYWRNFGGPPCKVQEFVNTMTPISPQAIENLLQSLNFGCRQRELDPNEHNAVGAGRFTFGLPEQNYLCQLRIEGNPQGRQQFRLTVCSPHGVVSSALKDIVSQQMLALH